MMKFFDPLVTDWNIIIAPIRGIEAIGGGALVLHRFSRNVIEVVELLAIDHFWCSACDLALLRIRHLDGVVAYRRSFDESGGGDTDWF
jgi:hypothetical protein